MSRMIVVQGRHEAMLGFERDEIGARQRFMFVHGIQIRPSWPA